PSPGASSTRSQITPTSTSFAPRSTRLPKTPDVYWYNAARDIFRTGLFFLLREAKTSNRDIWEFFSQPLQQIRDAPYTLPVREIGALKHIDKADSNQAASVISILQERLTFFRYLTDGDGSFSFGTGTLEETWLRALWAQESFRVTFLRGLLMKRLRLAVKSVEFLSAQEEKSIQFLRAITSFSRIRKNTTLAATSGEMPAKKIDNSNLLDSPTR
ncbi:MAG: hypothetical protein DMG05_16260, partial [Acidobacteria bacterium]